ncbi:mCG1042023 [Mus musculus]|nr:mCG1042023 [Mus musculus]
MSCSKLFLSENAFHSSVTVQGVQTRRWSSLQALSGT